MHYCVHTMTPYHAWWYCESQMALIQKALCWAIFFTYTLKSKLFMSNCTFVRQLVLSKLQIHKIIHARPEKKETVACSIKWPDQLLQCSLFFFLICCLVGLFKQWGEVLLMHMNAILCLTCSFQGFRWGYYWQQTLIQDQLWEAKAFYLIQVAIGNWC